MTPTRLLLIVCLLGFPQPSGLPSPLWGRGAGGEGVALTQKKGPAMLEVHSDDKTLKLVDLITVTLTVEGSPELDVHGAPLELPAAAPWILVERSKPHLEKLDPKRVGWRLTYRFAPRAPGKKIPFAFPVVKFRDGAEHTVSWEPIAFDVHTDMATPDRAALRDITSIEKLPHLEMLEEPWRLWLMLAGVALLLLAVALGVRRFLRRKMARSPAHVALYEWHRLMAMKLPESGRSERFVTLLTMLVRRYLERQFALPARRQTTLEFLQLLDQTPTLTAEEKQFLAGFLQRCDAVKFAQDAMPPDECHEWGEAAKQFLQSRLPGSG